VVAVTDLTAALRKQINQPRVRLYTHRHTGVDADSISIGGNYDHDEDIIEINLIYNSEQQHIDIYKLNWPRLSFDLAECIGHELVHRSQYSRKRRPLAQYRSRDLDEEKRQEQEYLGSAEELEAYGYSIAAELAAIHNIFTLDESALKQVVMYQVYTSTFDNDESIVLKLRKQISKYLRRLEVDYNDKIHPRTRSRRH
jgi:DNA-binding transcriptional ArsR family regulator